MHDFSKHLGNFGRELQLSLSCGIESCHDCASNDAPRSGYKNRGDQFLQRIPTTDHFHRGSIAGGDFCHDGGGQQHKRHVQVPGIFAAALPCNISVEFLFESVVLDHLFDSDNFVVAIRLFDDTPKQTKAGSGCLPVFAIEPEL